MTQTRSLFTVTGTGQRRDLAQALRALTGIREVQAVQYGAHKAVVVGGDSGTLALLDGWTAGDLTMNLRPEARVMTPAQAVEALAALNEISRSAK